MQDNKFKIEVDEDKELDLEQIKDAKKNYFFKFII